MHFHFPAVITLCFKQKGRGKLFPFFPLPRWSGMQGDTIAWIIASEKALPPSRGLRCPAWLIGSLLAALLCHNPRLGHCLWSCELGEKRAISVPVAMHILRPLRDPLQALSVYTRRMCANHILQHVQYRSVSGPSVEIQP